MTTSRMSVYFTDTGTSLRRERPCTPPRHHITPRRQNLRGCRNTVGNLVEFFLGQKSLSRASRHWHMREEERCLIEFEISNSTISTVFCQPLRIGDSEFLGDSLPASVKKQLLRIRIQVGKSALKTPNPGLDCGFRCRIAGQGLAQKECLFHRRRYE